MKALEFKAKIKNNRIQIPIRIQSELETNQDVRVIVLIDDSEKNDDLMVKQAASAHFLQGFAKSDSIYDNY